MCSSETGCVVYGWMVVSGSMEKQVGVGCRVSGTELPHRWRVWDESGVIFK